MARLQVSPRLAALAAAALSMIAPHVALGLAPALVRGRDGILIFRP